MTTFTFCRTSGDIWGSGLWRGGGGSKTGARKLTIAMVQEETRDLGPEPVGEPLCAVQGRKANESRRKSALDRDRRRPMSRSVASAPSLGGVRNIFENSQDEEQARAALDTLKQMPRDQRHSKPFEKVLRFLESHFEWMTEYLRKDGVRAQCFSGRKRHASPATTGIHRTRRFSLREGSGQLSADLSGREISRIWTVHQLPPPRAHPT